jgi:2-dehydropantoate 2-reductase
MKIGVVGPGAMGCLLAGKIALAGDDVLLLDHMPERVEVINRQGLIIEGFGETLQVKIPITLNSTDLNQTELILVCVKAYDTRTIAQILQGVKTDSYFLTLQNGVGNVETLGEFLPKKKILAGITSHGATDLGPGRVRHAGAGDTFIGYGFPLEGSDPSQDTQLNQVKSLLDRAGFVCQLVPKIENLIWSKLLINVGINALTALTRLPNGKLMEFSGVQTILEEAVQEGICIGKNKGIKFIYPDPLEQVKKVCLLTSANISSMLQDVLKKKRTEIDFINGVMVEEGRKQGISVPVNSLLTRLVKTLEESYEQTVSL